MASSFLDYLQHAFAFYTDPTGGKATPQTQADAAQIMSSGPWSAVAAFFATVTDGRMWRSLGWLVLGLVLTVIGLSGLAGRIG